VIEHREPKLDFHDLISRLLACAYCGVFQPGRVCHSFANTGLFPLNKDAISDVAVASSLFTERKDPNDSETGIISGEKSAYKMCLGLPENKFLVQRYFWPIGK
jgi:hypothetical protein